jgi:hypothetical protein
MRILLQMFVEFCFVACHPPPPRSDIKGTEVAFVSTFTRNYFGFNIIMDKIVLKIVYATKTQHYY